MTQNEETTQEATSTKPKLWIVIPCYNEEAVLPVTAPQFLEELKTLISKGLVDEDSRVCFVNDGSKDSTWDIISSFAEQDEHYCGICLSRNRGHQNALLAGLMEARQYADVSISIDCDGQDDMSVMDEMMERYHEGAEIVYGVRRKRDTDTFFKRFTARAFYKTMSGMGADTIYDHADYRLISKTALDALAQFGEVNIFLRGMVPMLGFETAIVEYDRAERIAGESHYPLSKMLHLAFEGITSLSIKPIHIISGFGTLLAIAGGIGIIWVIIQVILGNTVSGWASTMCVLLFLGGVQLLSLGVIGEYVGKTYLEAKRRPRYIISKRTWKRERRITR